jgi:undecaprenyl-diphosphatase
MLGFGIILLIIRKTRRIGITIMILLVIATILTGYIKCGVDRDRPNLEFTGTPFLIELSPDTYALFCEGGFNASYPSGHAARATIIGIILGFSLSGLFPRGCYLLLLYPLLMSISRVYVLQHFPMDVIGGAILGALLAGVIGKKTKLYKIYENSKT